MIGVGFRRRDVVVGACCSAVGMVFGAVGSRVVVAWRPADAIRTSEAPSATAGDVGLRPSTALSLGRLDEAARHAVQAGGKVDDELAHLLGLNVIRGFLREPDGDVVLLGDRDALLPRIHLDDLAVALRNAYGVYPGVPGVSIDPDPDAKDPWRLQKVRVIGMPPSAMAARMVAIDYELKKVSAGLLKVGRVPSLWDLRETDALCAGTGHERATEMSTRFWFQPRIPPRPRFLADQDTVLILKPVEAQLLTERQFLDNKARVTGAAPSPPEVDRFARLVTEQLLATNDAEAYTHLRQDFRVIELATLLRTMNVPAEDLRYLIAEHSLRLVGIPRRVGGIRRDERTVATCDTVITERETAGSAVLQAVEETRRAVRGSRGGVLAQVQIEPKELEVERAGRLASLRERVRTSRPAGDAIAWAIR